MPRWSLGAATETIEVAASAARLQTETASVQKDVTREQIDSLELNGRNPIYMASLVPGARGGNLASLNFNFTQGPSNFNGSRNWENLITYDGAPATRTRANGTSLGAADVDSVSEIQVLTADYAAEYGRTSGGQIRIITRSGGRDFHGAAYEYFRNDALNANTWSRNLNASTAFVPPFHYNQFGFNIGGPFYIPNKFNTGQEQVLLVLGPGMGALPVHRYGDLDGSQRLMRQGNFSELLSPTNYFYGKTIAIKDPSSGNPFPNNIIPASQISPSGLGILKAYPAANFANNPLGGNGNFYVAATHPQNQRKDTLAVDMNLTDSQRLQFRRNNYSFWEYQPLDGTPTETPKYFNRPNQTNSARLRVDHQPHDGERISGDGQPGRCLHSGGPGALLRSHHGRNRLPVHFPERQADSHAYSDGEYHQLQRSERRPVPIALLGSDLHAVGQLDVGSPEPHHQGGLRVRAFRRERQ